jgi:sulfur-oxidizing protein SoxY
MGRVMLDRRRALLAVTVLPLLPAAPARATPEAMAAAMRAYTGGAEPQDGRVTIEIAELVENGNAVPVRLSIDSPMTGADHVRSLALFTERNPQPEVAVFHLTPYSGRARVDTRIRLATSQRLVALATTSDGRCWRSQVDVLVTLAACVEG